MNYTINYYFGQSGCGKTTYAVYLCDKERKKNRSFEHIYNNFDCFGVPATNVNKLGEYTFPPCSMINIDEAGIQYNNRSTLTFPKRLIEWVKLHRHYKCTVNLFSQSWEDVDITFRRMAHNYYYLKRLGCFTLCRKVDRFIDIDRENHQIIDGYKFKSILWSLLPPPLHQSTIKIIYRPKYYKYFDSYITPDTPIFENLQDVPINN